MNRVPLLERHKFRDRKIRGVEVRKCKFCGSIVDPAREEFILKMNPCPKRRAGQ